MNTMDDRPDLLAAANRALARRRAIRRGDMGSPIEPITFAPFAQCEHCDCNLTDATRSHIMGVCQRCLEELVSLNEQELRRREAKLAKEASRTGSTIVSTVIPWLLLACAGAVLVAWLGANAAWVMGKAL